MQDIVTSLIGRVGWRQFPASFPFALNFENTTSLSGRYFQDFSALVTLTRINDTMDDAEADEQIFNEYLLDLQRAAINTLVSAILRENTCLTPEQAKTRLACFVQDTPEIFDEAIGLQMACAVVDKIQHAPRSNETERTAKETSSLIFQELNGTYTETGVPVSFGLKNRLSRELKHLRGVIFPKPQPSIVTYNFD